jgi:hypothetical protein
MVMCCRFPEARAIAKEAERVEAVETEKMQRTAELEVMRKQARMMERQEREIAAALEYYDKAVAQTKGMMETGVATLKRRITALENIKVSPVKAPAVLPGDAARSPRSLSSYFEFRAAWPGRTLALKSISGLAEKCRKLTGKRTAFSAQDRRK